MVNRGGFGRVVWGCLSGGGDCEALALCRLVVCCVACDGMGWGLVKVWEWG